MAHSKRTAASTEVKAFRADLRRKVRLNRKATKLALKSYLS